MRDTLKDLTGMRFGNWLVIRRAESDTKQVKWLCRCDCGTERIVQGTSLKGGLSKSCGCRKVESPNKTHGLSNTHLYKKWRSIRNRCENKNDHKYDCYGGRGITVCDEWKNDFTSFYEWATTHGYKRELELDRIDNNKGYSPSNCRFVSHKQNLRNMKRTLYVAFNGETKPLIYWCELLNMSYRVVYQRVRHYGWNVEKALTTPIRNHKEYRR